MRAAARSGPKIAARKIAAPKIDIVVDAEAWNAAPKVRSILRRAIKAATAAKRSTRGTELAIVLSDDSAVRLLNRDWRGIDAATNVLSFPTPRPPGHAAGDDSHLGDIVLAFETIAREARAEHKPFAHHLAHLAVHGYLHLIGFDHQRTKDAAAMEQAERDILRQLAIPDPYRSSPQHPAELRAKNPAKPVSKRSAKRAGKA